MVMRRIQDRQISTPPSSSSSLYLKSHYLQDRDSGYTEADSDLDYPSLPSRVGYPFSDDDEPVKQTTSKAFSKPFLSSTTSASSLQAHTSASYQTYQADKAIESVRQLACEHDWKKVLKHKSGVVVHMLQKQVNGDKVAVFKGEAVIEGFSPQSVFYVIGMRKLWDEQFEDGNLVQNLNETTSITYEAYKSNGSSRAYDLTLVEKIDCSHDGVIVFACTSVDTSNVIKVAGRTRQEVKLHGWILKSLPTSPPSTHVTFITEEVIRGWIPGLTKKSLARKPLVIASINNYLQHKAQGPRMNTSQARHHQHYQHTEHQSQKPPLLSQSSSNKLLSPLSAYHRRRPSIMNPSTQASSSASTCRTMLTNPPPRRSSLNPNQQKPSRSSSLTKRITFADNVIVPSSAATTTVAAKDDNTLPVPVTITKPGSHSLTSLTASQDRLTLNLGVPSLETTSVKLYPPARHRSTRKESMAKYKRLYSSDIDEWKEIGKRGDVKLYSKASQGYALPMLRGDGYIEGSWTTEQLCSVVQCFGARSKWDDYFEHGHIVERFSQKEYLVYLQMRSIFPIHSRDFSLLTQIESEARSGTIHVVSASVSDQLTPETNAHTRARMLIYGWTFQTVKDDQGKRTGVNMTFITHMDLAGSTPLPSAIIRLLTTEVPACVHNVQKYLSSLGCPPYIRRVAGKIVKEQFNPHTSEYTVSYIAKHLPSRQHVHNEQSWCTDIRVHSSVYKQSFNVTTHPQEHVLVVKQPSNIGIRVYTESDRLDGTIIDIIITPATVADLTEGKAIDQETKPSPSASTSTSPTSSTNVSFSTSTSPSSLSSSSSVTSTLSNNIAQVSTTTIDDSNPRSTMVALPSVHPLAEYEHISDKQGALSRKDGAFDPNVGKVDDHSSMDTYSSPQQRQRNNSIIIIGDQLSFNGPQLSVVVLLMLMSYYVGKLSCRC